MRNLKSFLLTLIIVFSVGAILPFPASVENIKSKDELNVTIVTDKKI